MEDHKMERGQGTLSAPFRRAPLRKKSTPHAGSSRRVARVRRTRFGLRHVFLGFLILYCGTVIAGGLVFALGVRSALSHVKQARVDAEHLDFIESKNAILEARADIILAQQGLFALSLLKPIPYLGNQVRAVDSVVLVTKEGLDVVVYALDTGNDILNAADELRTTIQDQENFSFYDIPPETRARILNAVAVSSSHLQTMRVRTRLALDELARVHEVGAAPPLLKLIAPIEELLPKIERSIEFFIPMTSMIRELAGVGEDKQWLVLYLNNNELRPAGGFIGVYGTMLVRDGELVHLGVEDVMRADALVQGNDAYRVNPPQPIRDYLGVSNWYFRDANWSPDFKTSADTAVQLLRQQHSFAGTSVPSFNGVIGLTPTVAERVMAYLGPIELDGFTFTSENVRELLQEETQFAFLNRGLTVDQRKDLIAKLTDEVVDRLIALPLSSLPDVIDIFMDSFEDKQMAMRSYADDAQSAIEQAKWGSVVTAPQTGDTLMVVDANMAALKTDPVIDRAITYTITPQGDRLRARVAITYIHKGAFTKLVSRYRTFTRIFVPEGSELIHVEGNLLDDRLKNPNGEKGYVLTERDLGFTSFGTFTAVEPGRTQTLVFEYYLPNTILEELNRNAYHLQLFKQMGAKDHALTLVLDFDKNIHIAEPSEARKDRGNDRYEWQGVFSSDRLIDIRF